MKHRPITWGLLAWAILLLICGGCGGKPIPIPPPPPGRVCAIYGEPWCDCYVPITEGGLIHWEYRKCPAPSPTPAPTPAPTPSPSPTPTPTPAPSPTPGPVPSPTPSPSPSPSPCTPITETVPACESGYTQCWKCADRIAWDVERGNWTPLPGKPGLYYNDPGGDPAHREYIDSGCNKVDRDGRILRKLEGGCEPNWICPPDKTVTHACPSPSPSPGPSPTPPPSGHCPDIAGLGGQVAQFQLNHQTVGWHREGDVYVSNGPADKVNFDSTVYYGCAAPRCDPEHDPSLARCEDPRGQTWRVIEGSLRNGCTTNNEPDGDCAGRGFGYMGDDPSREGAIEACTGSPWEPPSGEHVGGRACKVIRWRVSQ